MPTCKIEELKTLLPTKGRLLGLDVGTKTVGLALSDETRTFTSPKEVITRTKLKQDLQTLLNLIEKEQVIGAIVGLPLNMDGTEGPKCQSVRQFARDLLKVKDFPLAFWDERLSTAAVERTMIDADLSRAKRDAKIDSAAAAYILEGALQRLKVI